MQMLYKRGDSFQWEGRSYDIVTVHESEIESYEKQGWFTDPLSPFKEPEDNSAPTREELEIKAKELNIEFDGRTSDRKLMEKIEEALK